MEHTGAQAIQYFVSEYISPEANLYVLLVITIVAVPLFTVADAHYGSGTSRNICGKKRPASVDIGSDWSDAAPARSVKEKGTCRKDIICIEAHSIYVPYGRKFWRGIYFGGLAVLRAIRQYFIRQKLHTVMSSLLRNHSLCT